MVMDMTDVEKALEDPNHREYLEQCLKTNTVIEYNCKPGADRHIYIKGLMPTLFSGICTILKAVVTKERPEKRKELLDLIREQVLEELTEEGHL